MRPEAEAYTIKHTHQLFDQRERCRAICCKNISVTILTTEAEMQGVNNKTHVLITLTTEAGVQGMCIHISGFNLTADVGGRCLC